MTDFKEFLKEFEEMLFGDFKELEVESMDSSGFFGVFDCCYKVVEETF